MKKEPNRIRLNLVVFSCFFLLYSLTGSAQVHTPRYHTTISSNSNGFYEYLPQGYETGKETYPLIIFIQGKGGLGTGDAATMPRLLQYGLPKLINDGKFPVSFMVDGMLHKFIVISPQFGVWPSPHHVDEVLNYAVSHYRVNSSRIYLTGLSMGGGAAWDYAGHNSITANRLAAIVPVCGSSYPELPKGRVMAAANLPVWATHNNRDDVVPVYKTDDYIDYINQAPAPDPLARKTIFDTISHDAWTKTYNPFYKENGLNIYEWMLKYQRRSLTAGSNSPVCYDSVLQLSAPEIAGATYTWTGPNGFISNQRAPSIAPVTSAVAGTYTVTLTKGDSTATAATVVEVSTLQTYYKDGDQDGYGDLATTIVSCRAPLGYRTRSGDCNDANSKIYPGAPELCDGKDNDCDGQTDEGVTITRYYRDADKDGWGHAGVYRDSCAPPVGYVVRSTDCNDTKASVYPGAPEIADGLDNDCNGKIDDNPVPCVKVNVFGGTNPYNSTEWNNWNVTASLTSSAFKYNNATASGISATLSSNYGVADNGATYGSGMAPAEVLRYVSTSNTARTLTLNGLSPAKKYNLELYASRSSNSGYTTVFSIGTTSVSIGTYQNLANKASFVNLVPNAGGQIMVNIKNNSAYSYLNGFVLYEITNPAATALSQIYGDAEKQTEVMLTEIAKVQATNPALVSPFTLENDNLKMVPSSNWTSGFFPGMLWNLYEYTGKAVWADRARSFTSKIEKEQYDKSSHDVGFKIYNSFGPGYRLTKDPAYRDVIIQSAKSLATRFNSKVGCIRSWDWNTRVWQYPVIIDNMMNLELLFAATRLSGDSSFYKIAVSHANATLKNHYRPDYSSYHVVDYDTLTGGVRKRMTFQGYSDASAWSRGQAWGLYGFAMCYRETKNKAYLEIAEKIADYLLNHLKMPADKIPYWDFDAPGIPNEPRDASAAAVTASALYELMKFSSTQAQRYRVAADNMVKSLTEQYRSAVGENKGFILLHSTGSKPSNSDVDKPLIYADYYYLEALLRSRDTVPGGGLANGFPVANAGSDQTITLPASTVTLNGSGTDADGTITAYKWEKFSGPSQFTLANAATQALTASNLVQGTYVFRLTVTDNSGAIVNDDVAIGVNPAASTTTRYIKVNLFGGSNPYNHVEWNNWNVNSSLNSGTLKYSNATLSGISAALTKNTLADNGSSYGGTMAPPEVLRYTSYATSERTLTFSGLAPDKTYNLELYASRAKTGNSTVFSVGTSSVTILTDNNKTVKASFTNLKANSSGQLLVSIKNLNTYNYLNGFILTETSNTTTTTQAKAADVITETAPAFKVEAFPNPASRYFTLKVQSGSHKPVQVHIVDVVGRIVEIRQGLASNTTFPVGARYRPGIYYVEAVQDGKRVTIKLVKSAW